MAFHIGAWPIADLRIAFPGLFKHGTLWRVWIYCWSWRAVGNL